MGGEEGMWRFLRSYVSFIIENADVFVFVSGADVYIELTVHGSREERTDNDILA